MKKIKRLAAAILSVLSGMPPTAWANLQVFPTRLLLTDQTKAGYVSIRHVGDKAETYHITAVFYRMKPDGSLELVSDVNPDEKSAIPYLRFSPREVSLQPRGEQVVRIMAHNTQRLADGEYRAHVRFEPITVEVERKDPASKKMQFDLKAKIAVAIPIFVRKGNATMSAKLSEAKWVENRGDGKPGYKAMITNTGQTFLYGDLIVSAKTGDNWSEVGRALGVSSYVPTRTISFPFTAETEDLAKKSKEFRIEYRESSEDGAKTLSHADFSK